jgi:hypothetical protein
MRGLHSRCSFNGSPSGNVIKLKAFVIFDDSRNLRNLSLFNFKETSFIVEVDGLTKALRFRIFETQVIKKITPVINETNCDADNLIKLPIQQNLSINVNYRVVFYLPAKAAAAYHDALHYLYVFHRDADHRDDRLSTLLS